MKMDNEWKNSLRERFSDFSVPEPEELWEGIEQGLAGGKRRNVAPIWWISGATAAAAVAALVLFLRPSAEQTVNEPVPVLAEAVDKTVEPEPSVPETEAVPEVRSMVSSISRRSLLAESVVEPETVVPVEPEVLPNEPETVPTEPEAVIQVPETVVSIPETIPDEQPETALAESSAFTVGLYREGGQEAFEASQGYGMYNTGDFFTRATANNTNTPSGLMQMLSSNRASNLDVRHGAPVRMGVTVAWQLLPWLSLASGMNWTRLNSSFTESTVGTRAVTRQELGYLGVPLRLEAGFMPMDRFRLYAGAGVMAETCLLASATTDSYIGDHLEGTESTRPDGGGLLWSVGASAGAEYRFNPHVGLYFAPGIEYHFDNGAKVQSAYTAKPLHYNLSLGLRFNFGQ